MLYALLGDIAVCVARLQCFVLLGYPLFPGENEVEQLACIMEIMGLPPNMVLEQATRRRLFFGEFSKLQDFVIILGMVNQFLQHKR